jgi:hypothetical protein
MIHLPFVIWFMSLAIPNRKESGWMTAVFAMGSIVVFSSMVYWIAKVIN